MKQFTIIFFATCLTSILQAQVGIGTISPDASAQLDITATNKGILIPRITQADRPASPAIGLLIYQTDNTPGFYFWTGSIWQSLSGWGLKGNSGSNSSNNFIGTTDNVALHIKVFNQLSGQISPTANSATSFGYQTLTANTGQDNTSFGYQALQNNTSGGHNTAFGYQAVRGNIAAWFNTGVGSSTLSNLTTGGYNTALGSEALYKNSTGNENTAIGYAALTDNTIGRSNTSVGYSTNALNTEGSFNSSLGYESLKNSMTGNNNTAIGYRALYNNITGSGNTAIGYRSGGTANNLTNVIAIGNTASPNSSFATVIGDQALVSSLAPNAIAIGTNATISSTSNATGSIAIGHSASVHSVSGVNVSNSIAIGQAANVTTSNTIHLGNTSITAIKGQVNWSTYSDGRFKEEVKENVPGLTFIKGLRPVSYVVNKASLQKHYYKSNPTQAIILSSVPLQPIKRETGFIAQEVEKTAKKLSYEFSGVDIPANEDALYSLRYSEFVVPLVKAVQEQQTIIEIQSQEIEKLKKQMSEVIKEVQRMQIKQ